MQSQKEFWWMAPAWNWRNHFGFLLAMALWGGTLAAHPMGNFSISHYAGLHIRRDSLDLRYEIDMAEIPTFQEMQQGGLTARQDDPGVSSYLTAKASEFATRLSLALNGRALVLRPVSQEAIFPPGAGNLPTMRLGLVYRADYKGACTNGSCELEYHDDNFPGRAGWKEIVTSLGPGIQLAGGAQLRPDRSAMLSNYPTDLLNSPPQDLAATVAFSIVSPPALASGRPLIVSGRRSVGVTSENSQLKANHDRPHMPVIGLQPNRQPTPRNAFTELMSQQQVSLGVAVIAALVAAGLGALHALEPGHGKTIVAAYLVGSKGTPRHALLLGAIVTISHTAGVYLLGGVTLYAQKYVLPDRLYPFLGVMSGVLIAGMGLYLLLQRFAGAEFAHSHGTGGHSHAPFVERAPKTTGARQITLLGITGGMVPCPAALVVLLSAVALHRVGFGLFLIVAFSLGLGAVLIAIGLAAVCAGRVASRIRLEGLLLQRWLPITSAALIMVLGCVVAARGLMSAGMLSIRIGG